MAAIYRKTSKGLSEIGTRALKLSPRLRSLLILVDGRRGDDELLRMMPAPGADGIRALAADGLIELIGVTNDAPVRAEEPAPAYKTVSPVRALEALRRDLVHALIDQAGPMAETLAIRIERSAHRAELLTHLEAAIQLVASARGRTASEAFRLRFADAINQLPDG